MGLSRPNMHLPLVVVCVCVTLPRLTHRHQPLSQIHELISRTWVSSSHPLCSFLNEKRPRRMAAISPPKILLFPGSLVKIHSGGLDEGVIMSSSELEGRRGEEGSDYLSEVSVKISK